MLVFLSALIGGLQASLITKTLGSQPHITLRMPREEARPLVEPTAETAIASLREERPQRLRSIDQWPTILDEVEATAGVLAASPSVTGAGFAVRAEAKSAIVIRGVDADRFLAIIDVRARLIAGRFEVDGDDVVIGSRLAAELGVAVGDKLRIASSEASRSSRRSAGSSRSATRASTPPGCSPRSVRPRRCFGLPAGVTTIDLKVAAVFDAERIARDLRERTGLRADSWMTLNADLLAGLSAQSSSKAMIQFFVVIAVALGIASVLIRSVVQKSREIGILRAGQPATSLPRGRAAAHPVEVMHAPPRTVDATTKSPTASPHCSATACQPRMQHWRPGVFAT